MLERRRPCPRARGSRGRSISSLRTRARPRGRASWSPRAAALVGCAAPGCAALGRARQGPRRARRMPSRRRDACERSPARRRRGPAAAFATPGVRSRLVGAPVPGAGPSCGAGPRPLSSLSIVVDGATTCAARTSRRRSSTVRAPRGQHLRPDPGPPRRTVAPAIRLSRTGRRPKSAA